MSNYTITDQERSILTMVARGEAMKSDPYASVYPSKVFSEIKSMTLKQLKEFQEARKSSGLKSDACGKYQFVGYMLWGCYWKNNRSYSGSGCDDGLISQVGASLDTVFNKDFQDWLIIQRLKRVRGLENWKAGKTPVTKHTSDLTDPDIAFQVELCREFASVPLPVPRNGKARGDSYYQGALNKAAGHHGPDEVFRELQRMRGKGPGEVVSLSVVTGEGIELGQDFYTKSRVSTGGGTTTFGGSVGRRAPINRSLPQRQSPYTYRPIDPEDTRYDFRLGEKVAELPVNGTSPVAASGFTQSRPPTNDIGAKGISDENAESITESTKGPDDGLRGSSESTGTVGSSIRKKTRKSPTTVSEGTVSTGSRSRRDSREKSLPVSETQTIIDDGLRSSTDKISDVHTESVTPLSQKPDPRTAEETPKIGDFVLKSVYGDANNKVATVQNTKNNTSIKLTVNQRVWFQGAIVTEIVDGGKPENDKVITDQGEIPFGGNTTSGSSARRSTR